MLRFVVPSLVTAATIAASGALAQSGAPARPEIAELCASCHGPDGNSTVPVYPSLAGQTGRYIYLQLRNFQEGRRTDSHMSPIAKNLSRDDMMALGNFFAAQKRLPIPFKSDPTKAEAGRKTSDAVGCPACHLEGLVGQSDIPRIAGQWPQYIKKQLQDFQAKRRADDAGSMTGVAGTLSDDDVENLAQYIANLP